MNSRILRFASLSVALTLVVATPVPAQECTQLFGAASSTPFGFRPNSVVLADLNHDGILDAILTMRDTQAGGTVQPDPGSTVAVMLGGGTGGVGNGTFGPPVLYPVGSGPQGIAVTELDGDGHADLAVTNGVSNNISILHGAGDGSFGPPVNIPGVAVPFGIVAADLNQDGLVDLSVAANGAQSVNILLGLGGGAFATPVAYPVGDYSLSLAVADLNHDNQLDIVATAYNTGMVALLGNGNGTFQTAVHYSTNGQPYSVALADVNEDGHLDMLAGNQAYGGLAVLQGTGTGTFLSPTLYGHSSWTVAGIAVSDLNSDGISDVVLTDATANSLRVLLGQGSGGVGNGLFTLHSSYPCPSYPVGIAAGTLNGDAAPDVVVAGYGSLKELTFLGACISNAPHLESVRDVPNDNGGKVFLTWTRSMLDVSGGSVNQYRVWRRIPPSEANAALAEDNDGPLVMSTPSPDGTNTVFWEALVTLPAQRLDGYGYTAATTQDSMANSNPYTAFFVSALTSDIDVFYSSNVDSSYSVDNIIPDPPTAFAAQWIPAGVSLQWDGNGETDLAAYRLYRGTTVNFVPSEQNLIASLTDTTYLDVEAQGTHYYKLTAVDVHENESGYAVTSPPFIVGVGDTPMAAFDLRGVPNPSRNGVMAVHLSLPAGAVGRLEVLDLAGRRVATRTLQASSGRQVVVVGERDPLPTGVYLVRLSMGQVTKEMKAIVMR